MHESVILLLKGLLLGFSMAAPVGPVGVLCIRRTLHSGRLHGFVTGLAVAVTDAFFGLIAGLGITAISQPLLDHQATIRLIGGLVMVGMGWHIYFSSPPKAREEARSGKLLRHFFSAFALTITNPMTLLSFAAIFVALDIGSEVAGHISWVLALVAGVFIGSCSWFVVLTQLASSFKGALRAGTLGKINRITGAAIFIFGLYAVTTGAMATFEMRAARHASTELMHAFVAKLVVSR